MDVDFKSGLKPGITVIMVSWKREANVKKIIGAFKKQTIVPKIFVWNNNPNIKLKDKRVDWYVNSSVDLYSYASWMMSPMVETEYVLIINDDLCPKNPKFLERLISLIKEHPDSIVGPFGRTIVPGQKPYNSPEVRTGHADIVKGRCMGLRTELLKKVPLGTEGPVRNDDIWVCFYAAKGKKMAHYVDWKLRQMTEDLPEGNVGMDKEPHHMSSRNELILELINKEGHLE